MNNRLEIKKRSQLQEKRAAKDVGGKLVAGSGAAKFSGGSDVRKQGELRIECKFTEKTHYTLVLSELEKLSLQALKAGLEEPIFQIEFVRRSTGASDKYAVRPHILHAEDTKVLAVTDRKRIRLEQVDLQRALIDNDEVHVGFKKKDRTKWYDIMTWDEFLSRRSGKRANAGNKNH